MIRRNKYYIYISKSNEASGRSQLFPRYKTIKNVGIDLISKNKYNDNKL